MQLRKDKIKYWLKYENLIEVQTSKMATGAVSSEIASKQNEFFSDITKSPDKKLYSMGKKK